MSEPWRHGVCYIVHQMGDRKSTWSKPVGTLVEALEIVEKLHTMSPGLVTRLDVTEYKNGKVIQ